MALYKDVFSGDTMFDSTRFQFDVVDDIAYCVKGQYKPLYESGGAAAETPEKVQVRTAIDLVEAHGLRLHEFTRTRFLAYLKAYAHKVCSYLRNTKQYDRLEMFQANLQAFSRQLTCNFRTFTFYTGPSDEVEDSLAMCFFKEDQIIPYFYFFIDGLREEKL